MTPAVNLLRQKNVTHAIHEYEHDPAHESFGLEASEKLGIPAERIFKTLLVEIGVKELAVGIVPVSSTLNMKSIAKALDAKKAKMAAAADVERSTGYVLGGVSPLGQKRQLKTIIDSSAEGYETIFVSGGRRGLEIELSPSDLKELTRGKFFQIQES